MRKCPDCGFEFDDDKSFCPSCGKYMPRIKNPYPSAEQSAFTEREEPAKSEPEKELLREEEPAFERERSFSEPDEQMSFEHGALSTEQEALSTGRENAPSAWSFVLTIFLLSLPVVGLIYAIALACGGTKYEAKKSLARGIFLYGFILLVLISAAVIVTMLVFGEENFALFVNDLLGMEPLL